MKEAFLRTGLVFGSDTRYVAGESCLEIHPETCQRMSRLIGREAVPVAFVLRGLKNVVIDLGGATVRMHGQILPFVLENCSHITLRNFTVDCVAPLYLQAAIQAADGTGLQLEICDGFPYQLVNGRPVPMVGGQEFPLNEGHVLLQPFDPHTAAPAYGAGCMLASIGHPLHESENPPFPVKILESRYLGGNRFLWQGSIPPGFHEGQILTIPFTSRSTPGIYACDCQDLAFENIRMKRVGGFGIHAYFCRNLAVRHLTVKMDEGSQEYVSINADGVHCIGCEGQILIEDSVLENMLDDGGNFHGYFTPVTALHGREVLTSLDFPSGETLAWHRLYRPGDLVNVYQGKTRLLRGQFRVEGVAYEGEKAARISGDQPLEALIRSGDHLEAHEKMPEIHIRGVRTGKNRPRGFLLSSWRRTLVEDCFFNNCSVGIDFTGDMNYWFESGPVEDVTLRNNTFYNCGYCSADCSISAGPVFESCAEAPCFHSGIRVLNNTFKTFLSTTMHLRYCDQVEYRDNRVIPSAAYPAGPRSRQVILHHCGHVETDIIEAEEQ